MSAKPVNLVVRVNLDIKSKLESLGRKKELSVSQLTRRVIKDYITAEEASEASTQKLSSEVETLTAEIQKLYADIVECEKEKRDPAPLLAKHWELIKHRSLLQKQLESVSTDNSLPPNVRHISDILAEV